MSARKTERLLNLVIALLHTRRYLSAEQIRNTVAGYKDSTDEAFKRMFERDKEDLRDLGIPLEVGTNSTFDDEPGYRIRRDDYALPDLALAPDEIAALGVAARAWQHASLGAAASGALLKLRAAGVTTDDAVPVAIESRVSTSEPAFEQLRKAAADRRPVTFDYRESGARRHLEPWGAVSWHGRWYAVGHDRDRAATRVFRLDRIVGPVGFDGPPGSFDVLADLDVRGLVLAAIGGEQSAPVRARLRVRSGAGHGLRRRAAHVHADGGSGGWDLVELTIGDVDRLVDLVLGFGDDVEVLEPVEARTAVGERLRALLAELPT